MERAMEMIEDHTGFPMLWVEPLEAHLGWLPVTKIQFERFLCETADDRFGPRWYDEVLSLNPRTSPYAITSANYWQAFMTGLLPTEAESFVHWMGEEYRLPTLVEWNTAFTHLRGEERETPDWERALPRVDSRCRALLDGVGKISSAARPSGERHPLSEQMLLRSGVMEWVRLGSEEQAWGGMGEVTPSFAGLLFDPEAGEPHRPYHPENERISFYGFRLLRKEQR